MKKSWNFWKLLNQKFWMRKNIFNLFYVSYSWRAKLQNKAFRAPAEFVIGENLARPIFFEV